jgi:predicted nucleic acid-binding protein
MRRSEPTTQTFLLDNNVFIAAIRDQKKQTKTLKLLIKIIKDQEIKLVGDKFLAEEMLRYTELLKSKTATTLVAGLLTMTTIVNVAENYRKICKAYLRTTNKADILHAAVCLQTNSILITNDKHFDKIRKEGIIKVWSITEAIRKFLINS